MSGLGVGTIVARIAGRASAEDASGEGVEGLGSERGLDCDVRGECRDFQEDDS